ncbi:MAG: PIN domain-containing protein [Calditrichaceae bacterium]|nr:PIN domain-containing protein [Calditrichaceae bacterium]MBN2708261.1 PIN domain-containing protein [Calditrichaceae bacterium]RQV95188.1 MAG: PIN domain-containing protein [Calditrichota bacterium]
MKIMTCFIDTSAWIAIVDKDDPNHQKSSEYLEQILQKNAKIITNNVVLDETIDSIKIKSGRKLAEDFSTIIDESILTINLRMDWVSRRMRRNALLNYLKSSSKELKLRHFFIIETIKKKKIDIIFSFDPAWKSYDMAVAPGY